MSSVIGERASRPVRAIVILVVLLLVVHAPLFLNDGVVMDDWLVLKVGPDYLVDLDFLLHGAGHPVFFGYSYLANMTGAAVVVMQAMTVAAILLGAVCLMLTATRSGLLSRTEAFWFAFIVWTYPGYQMWAGKANAVYVFSFGMFFVALWLFTLAFGTRGFTHAVLRIAAALTFFFSFALNSIMVLYAFAMFGLFIAIWRGNAGTHGPIRRLLLSGWRCALEYPEFAVLPLLYWGALNIWFKRIGIYTQHYDAHLPTFAELLHGWFSFFRFGYIEILRNAVRTVLDDHALVAVPIIPVLIAVVLYLRNGSPQRQQAARFLLPLLSSVALFLMLSLPYLAAGLAPGENFYESRHLLLFGMPLAVALLAANRLVGIIIGDRAATVAVFGLASIVSVTGLWSGYTFMQARVLKQEALSSHLAAMPKPDATVFNLDDGFLDYPSRHSAFGTPEVSGMLRLAWGEYPFLGFTLRAERPTILQEMELSRISEGSAYHHIDPSGPQATITFQPGPAVASNLALVRHYYACRLLVRCDVAAFLAQLATVKIDVGPIAGLTPLTASK